MIASKVASNIEASNNGMTPKEVVDNSVVPKQAWGNEVSCCFLNNVLNKLKKVDCDTGKFKLYC